MSYGRIMSMTEAIILFFGGLAAIIICVILSMFFYDDRFPYSLIITFGIMAVIMGIIWILANYLKRRK